VFKLQTQIIKGAMEMGSVWVATPEGDDDTIAGWICHVGPVAQFMYVKKPFRGFGVGKKLIEKAGLREPVMAAYMAPWMTDRIIYSPQLQHADVLKAFMEDT
jgi:GNAT superfamily N-acetyltransferase